MVPRQGILTTTERRSDRIEHTTIFCPMPPEVLRRSLCEKSFHIKEKAARSGAAFISCFCQNLNFAMSCRTRPETAAPWKLPYGLLGWDTVFRMFPKTPEVALLMGFAKFG
jgi:hypothetical protein